LEVRKNQKGAIAMVKKCLKGHRSILWSALEVLGWIAFFVGLVVNEPLIRICLLAIARVLP
jgi:hypothetical protein